MIPARFDPHASVTCPGLSQACVAGGRSGAQRPWGAWGMSPEKTAQPAEQARGTWPRGGPHSQRNSAGRTPGLAPGTGCGRVDLTTVRFRPSPESHRPKRPPAIPSRSGPGNEKGRGEEPSCTEANPRSKMGKGCRRGMHQGPIRGPQRNSHFRRKPFKGPGPPVSRVGPRRLSRQKRKLWLPAARAKSGPRPPGRWTGAEGASGADARTA